MSQTLPALDVAAYLCKNSSWTIPNTHLHKILYLIELNHIGTTGQALIAEDFYATDFGPLLPKLYKKCSCFGARPIRNIFWAANPVPNTITPLLDTALDTTRSMSGGALVAATHRTIGAWAKHYVPGHQIRISKADIAEEYSLIVNGHQQKTA